MESKKYYQLAPQSVKDVVQLWLEMNPSEKVTGGTVVELAMGVEQTEEVQKYVSTHKSKYFKGSQVPQPKFVEVEETVEAKQVVKAYMRLSRQESLEDNGFKRQQEMIAKEYKVDSWFKDVISGAVRNRPELDEMLEGLEEGDIVVIPAIDRLSRSTADLLEIVEVIKEKGAVLKSINEPWLDTSSENPMSEFLLTVMGALNQMERKMIADRIKQGVEVAKENGVKFGRPMKKGANLNHAIELYKDKKMSTRDIEKATGVSRSTLMRRVKELKAKGLI